MNSEIEKRELIAMSKGDSYSFELLFMRYHPRLIGFLNGFLKDEELAKDMAQDIFFNIWSQRERFAEVHSFNSYLFRMARNAVFNHYDHNTVHDKYELSYINSVKPVNETEDNLMYNELNSFIDRIISRMPTQRARIYRLSREVGLSNTEISEKLKINRRTVENQLSLALGDIRKALKVILIFFC